MLRFVAAFFADTVDLEGVARRLVVEFAPDLLLDFVHFR